MESLKVVKERKTFPACKRAYGVVKIQTNLLQAWDSINSGNGERGSPSLVQQEFEGVIYNGLTSLNEGKLCMDRLACNLGGL